MPTNNYADVPVRNERPRILFVDDDTALLAALGRQLQPDRVYWNMVFVVGGQRALDEIARRSFSVVVSDYRMPGVDGLAVVAAARAACPYTAAVMLTGDAEEVATWPAAASLHRLLAKPCSMGTLREAIESGLATVATVANSTMQMQRLRDEIGRTLVGSS